MPWKVGFCRAGDLRAHAGQGDAVPVHGRNIDDNSPSYYEVHEGITELLAPGLQDMARFCFVMVHGSQPGMPGEM